MRFTSDTPKQCEWCLSNYRQHPSGKYFHDCGVVPRSIVKAQLECVTLVAQPIYPAHDQSVRLAQEKADLKESLEAQQMICEQNHTEPVVNITSLDDVEDWYCQLITNLKIQALETENAQLKHVLNMLKTDDYLSKADHPMPPFLRWLHARIKTVYKERADHPLLSYLAECADAVEVVV